MTKLSRMFNSAHKKKSNGKPVLVHRVSSIKVNDKLSDETLLGDMFIKCVDGKIVDITGNNKLIISKTKLATDITAPDDSCCMEFNGKDTSINITDFGSFYLGLNDFTIDWWEYKLSLPRHTLDHSIPTTQYSFYKNSMARKQPMAVRNSDHKSIYLSSDGYRWDIADDKYMGTIPENTWVHWAVTRCNDNFYTFKNGILRNIWTSPLTINGSSGFFTIGSGPGGNNFYGYITNFRFIKEHPLWIENFKPTKDLFY